MKRIAVILLAFACSAFAQQPTAQQCRAKLADWVPMFKAVYSDAACQGDGSPACPFVAPVRQLSGSDLTHIPFEAEACAKVDKRHRYKFEQIAVRAENLAVMRLTYFIKNEDQVEWYGNWEKKQLESSK